MMLRIGLAMLMVTAFVETASAQPGATGSVDGAASGDAAKLAGERSGFTLGASIGRGRIDIACDICDDVDPITEGLSISLHGGVMVLPNLSIIGEYWSVRYNGRGSDWFPDSRDHHVAQHLVTAGAQLWLLRNLYVRGGLGVGWHHSDSLYAKVDRDDRGGALAAAAGEQGMTDDPAGRYTPAATAGIGFEFAHTTSFAADVQLRVGSTRRPDDEYQVHNVALTFGAAWY